MNVNNDMSTMKSWFQYRTNNHILLVRKYCRLIFAYDRQRFPSIVAKGKLHDKSKFKEPELTPYEVIAWMYKCKAENVNFEVPEEIKDKMNEATLHHITTNHHHPEFWSITQVNLINRDDRDKIERLIDATSMPDISIAEMCADWMAMSEEKGGSPLDWALSVINKRWSFTEAQVKLIYELLSLYDNK